MGGRDCSLAGLPALTLVFAAAVVLAAPCVSARRLAADDAAAFAAGNTTYPGVFETLLSSQANGAPHITVDPFQMVGQFKDKHSVFWAPGKGALLSGLEVWVGAGGVNGIEATFTNVPEGRPGLYGTKVGSHSSIALGLGEKITAMSLWDNGQPLPEWGFGAIKLTTDAGQTYEAGVPASHRGVEYNVDVGSGLVVGVAAYHGSAVNAFGAIFLKPLESASMEVTGYPTLQGLSPAGAKDATVLAYVTFNNYGDAPQHVRMSGSPTVTAQHAWTSNTPETLGIDVALRAGVPRVVEANGVPSNWTVTDAKDWTSDAAQEDVVRVYDLPLTVAPHSSVDAQATLGEIDLDIGFDASVVVIVEGGDAWKFPTAGRYVGLAYAVTVTLGNETMIGEGAEGAGAHHQAAAIEGTLEDVEESVEDVAEPEEEHVADPAVWEWSANGHSAGSVAVV